MRCLLLISLLAVSACGSLADEEFLDSDSAALQAVTIGSVVPVYGDALDKSFQDVSWAKRSLSSTTYVYSGTRAISFEPDNWRGLYFRHRTGLDAATIDAFEFWIRGGLTGDQKIQLVVGSADGALARADLAAFLPAGRITTTWQQAHVDLAALNVTSGTFTGVYLQDVSGRNQQAVYLDDIQYTPQEAPLQEDPPQDDPTQSSYDPMFRDGGGANQWWVEVYADAQSLEYEFEDGSRHPLLLQGYGAFAANDHVVAGTRMRLHATRADGVEAHSALFSYLIDQPVLDGSRPQIEPPTPTTASGTFYVNGRFLYDPCGNKVILRGVNKMNIWTDITGNRSFAEIAKTGANVVRIVWDTSGSAAGLDTVITNAVSNRLLPMVELHDATGNWSMLQSLVDYWVRGDVLTVIKNHESELLLNIGNEVGDGSVTAEQFRSGYALAISRLRGAGLNMPLVIDSTQWAYNINMVQANGPYLLQQDPLHNLLFSVHMYWSNVPAATIEAELLESANLNLPLIIGEFAAAGFSCSLDIDYRAILASSQAHEIGWIAWEWGPGNSPCNNMDMTTDNSFASLHDWGLVAAVTDPNSIQNTAEPILFFENTACD